MLSWVDMYADYIAAFVNPEAFKKFNDMQSVTAGASMDMTFVTPDALKKMKDAEAGVKFEPAFDGDIAERVRRVRNRLGRKVSERQEDIGIEGKPNG